MNAGRKLRDAMASKKYIFTPGITTPPYAMRDYAVDFKAHGAQAEIEFQKRLAQHPMSKYHEMAGFPAMKALEEKYLPVDSVKKKYDGAVGL